jgi:large subunit ribosomal protein L21
VADARGELFDAVGELAHGDFTIANADIPGESEALLPRPGQPEEARLTEYGLLATLRRPFVMYAIVKTGGKQYRAEAGRTLEVERLPVGEGDTVELGEVLMIADDGDVTIGTPLIEGARVIARVDSNGRAPKIIVFKYKSKVRSRKKTGHRQNFTRLTVEQIVKPGEEAKVIQPRPAKVEIPVPADGNLDTEEEAAEAIIEIGAEATEPVAATAEVAEPVEVTTAEAEAPKPRARRAAPAAEKKSAKPAAPKSKAAKPAAKAKAEKPVAKSEAKTDEKPKAPRRRLPLGRKKKETE